jgi:trehalose-phosphatase
MAAHENRSSDARQRRSSLRRQIGDDPMSEWGAEVRRISAGAFDAAIFDLDGVVTRTARVHAATWKRLFDEYLRERTARTGEPFREFTQEDYLAHVDGLPRYDGVAAFLVSRGIELPRGDPDDPPERETVCGLGNRKNALFRQVLEAEGVEAFGSSVALIRRLRQAGLKTALVSSSRNARAVLAKASLTELFDVIVDGSDAARLGLPGKPAPAIFLAAADRLGVWPARALIVEDALSGVAAGRAGGFGLVIGIDRAGQGGALREAGADVVVADLGELSLQDDSETEHGASARPVRDEEIARLVENRRPALFLDYDGTLTPIVARPDLAIMSDEMRAAVRRLAELCTVAIVSGRDRADVERLVGLGGLVYAGSHGFDIAGPGGLRIEHEQGAVFAEAVERASAMLQEALASIPGALVEPKRFAVAVHYRQVADADLPPVEAAVDRVLADVPELRKTPGKKVFELRPSFDWDKGQAVLWLIGALNLDRPEVLPFYLGDDTTDEDAFRALAGRGIGIFVGGPETDTAAAWRLDDPHDVGRFLGALSEILEACSG